MRLFPALLFALTVTGLLPASLPSAPGLTPTAVDGKGPEVGAGGTAGAEREDGLQEEPRKEARGTLQSGAEGEGSQAARPEPCRLPRHGRWVNQAGSVMTLEVGEDGRLEGTYATALGCRPGVEQPLVGSCSGHAVTFSVLFVGCGSTTAWAGTVELPEASGEAAGEGEPEGPVIHTLWHLVRGGEPAWDSIVAGRSTFRLQR